MAESVLQRSALALGVAFTAAAILRVGVWPLETPLPDPLPPELLQRLGQQGWREVSRIPAERRLRVSNGSGVVLTRPSAQPGGPVRLSLIPVRMRGEVDLSVQKVQRALGGQPPAQERTLKIGADPFLRFSGEDKQQRAATCLARGRALVDGQDLLATLGTYPRSVIGWLQVVAATHLPRDLSCVSTTLAVGPSGDADRLLSQSWSALRPALLQRD